ncbi:unnamed protein product [Caenorhabditis sp. 36 PRJEB53466]|nr:unnamed protein product [Caenorhabditis sp. 36 PRJEB53466]
MPAKILLIFLIFYGVLKVFTTAEVTNEPVEEYIETVPMYPFDIQYKRTTTSKFAAARKCGLQVIERMKTLCGGMCAPGSDFLVKKCQLEISDGEIIGSCCPKLVSTSSHPLSTTLHPMFTRPLLFPELQKSSVDSTTTATLEVW